MARRLQERDRTEPEASAKPDAAVETDLGPTAGDAPAEVPSIAAVTAALAGMAAAWVAAGSIGLVTHPLRHALAWLALAVALVAGWPPKQKGRSWVDLAWLIASAAAAVALCVPLADFYNVLAAAVVLAALALTNKARGVDRQLLAVTAAAVAVFGLYRLACASIPTVWSLADACGWALGRAAEAIWHKPLWLGATFGGVDFLVLMTALLAGWLISTRPPQAARAVYAVLAIAAVHLAYLTVLAFATQLAAALPEPPPVPVTDPYEPAPWSWSAAAASLLPWNVPLLGAALELAVAAAMFRWARWRKEDRAGEGEIARAGEKENTTRKPRLPIRLSPPLPISLSMFLLVLAVAVGPLCMLWLGTSGLDGKTVVVFGDGYLDWEKPVFDSYGQDSAGTYGMLPTFVASLGGRLLVSDDLSAEDLAAADVLVLLHPIKPWPDDRAARVWEYVRSGGSLLLVGEPRVHEEGLQSAFDEVLAPTRLRLRFDTAVSRCGHWQDSQLVVVHPATVGVDDRRDRFGMADGSSIDVRWPGRPMLVGRWGWSDPGSDALMTGVSRFDPGEKLGDLVLAAEESVGRGRVVVLSNTASLTNLGSVDGYPFSGRLLSYLAGRSGSPQAGFCQALAMAAWLALAALLVWFRQPAQIWAVALLAVLSAAATTATVRWETRVLPDSTKLPPDTGIACIDASHVEAYNDFDWTREGIAGLKLTLMRSGYLPLSLPKLSRERLAGADLLVSIAPARRFSRAECRAVDEFVRSGGIFIAMAGAPESDAINGVLDQFGFRIPHSPAGAREEPRPMGHFRTPYLDAGDYRPHVLFYAGWPISLVKGPAQENAEVLVHGFDDLPVVGVRYVDRGAVVVIGDTEFAMNKNLEYIGGEPFDGGYENAHFWRWLITRLTGRPQWIPPKPQGSAALEAAVSK